MPTIYNPVDTFLESEFLSCCPVPVKDCGSVRMLVKSDLGSTKWLNITPEQFKAIENILVYKFEAVPPTNKA